MMNQKIYMLRRGSLSNICLRTPRRKLIVWGLFCWCLRGTRKLLQVQRHKMCRISDNDNILLVHVQYSQLVNKSSICMYHPNSVLKKYSHSSLPSSGKSVQCTAFLVLSTPNFALIESGLSFLAISGSKGPHSSLNGFTGSSCLTSMAIEGPLTECSTIFWYSGKNQ